jgi:uncharacterized lipoprotein NlpE involved in copper resistance
MKNKLIFTAILTSILLVGCGNDASKQEIGNDKEKTNENFVSKPIKISLFSSSCATLKSALEIFCSLDLQGIIIEALIIFSFCFRPRK